ncbi:MAG: metal ABC transporter permease [Bacteroidales bacterium]|nr:metal ABC transporter permease [Bacteroidales bacterium]
MLAAITEYNFLFNSLLAVIFGSITAGIAGSYIVSKKMVFLSGGITHASFGGIGIAFFAGISPVLGAACFGVASAMGIQYMALKQKVSEDSAIGFLWAFGMAVGIIFIYLTPGYTPDLMSYLFGSILTINSTDLLALAVLAVILLLFFIRYYRLILYVAFDEEFARTFTSRVDLFKYVLIVLVSLVIVLNIRIAGVVLVLSLLTIPPNIALLFTRNFARMIIISILSGFIGMFTGLVASWYMNIPTGATIIFTLVLLWILSRVMVWACTPRPDPGLGRDKPVAYGVKAKYEPSPKPSGRDHEPRNPKPETRNPKPETRTPKPDIL